MSTPQELRFESDPYACRHELAGLAGEVTTMEARINGRAGAESARIDGEINMLATEHCSGLRAVLEANKILGQSMGLKRNAQFAEMKAMEEHQVCGMKAMQDKITLEIEMAKERLRGEIRI